MKPPVLSVDDTRDPVAEQLIAQACSAITVPGGTDLCAHWVGHFIRCWSTVAVSIDSCRQMLYPLLRNPRDGENSARLLRDPKNSKEVQTMWSRGTGTAVVLVTTLGLLAGCGETLFQSNFDATPINDPPAQMQQVGTAKIDGPSGSVVVVGPPVMPSGKWVQVRRPGPQAPVAGLQGNFSQFRGDGNYTVTATLFIPSGSGAATMQFEPLNQPVGTLTSFLHIDFMPDNRVRIDDKDTTLFGVFPRDQPFIAQVTLNISASGATAHIVLSGAGASGQADYNVVPALLSMARQFGAVRIWMGFPWTGTVDATNIVVKRKSD